MEMTVKWGEFTSQRESGRESRMIVTFIIWAKSGMPYIDSRMMISAFSMIWRGAR
jgi:hypothetical protein